MNVFNEKIQNTLKNLIPHETVACVDRDPPWFNSFMTEYPIIKKPICSANQ